MLAEVSACFLYIGIVWPKTTIRLRTMKIGINNISISIPPREIIPQANYDCK
jgi:hypothetical protein